jgi:hypothetical protein
MKKTHRAAVVAAVVVAIINLIAFITVASRDFNRLPSSATETMSGGGHVPDMASILSAR